MTPGRVDGSMSLLTDLMRDGQDPSYAAAAERRRSRAEATAEVTARGTTGRRTAAGVLAVVLVGLVSGSAVAAVRAGADGAAATREDLVDEIGDRTRESDARAREAEALRREVELLRSAGLERDVAGRAQAGRLAVVELAAAAVPVTGPGVVVEIDDREEGEPEAGLDRGGQLGDGRVQDRDLQLLVNGLWAAGAEAISVNDLRLTVRTAIRSAGEAVLVDFRPISPPYVVRAIGDPTRLEADYTDSDTGRRLATYATVNGLDLQVRSEDRLDLPAGSAADLTSAQASP